MRCLSGTSKMPRPATRSECGTPLPFDILRPSMSRTLFWYIFKDLLKIFFLASGCLAGIMSFGGLLRPLTEHGLGPGQVARILGYFMPAMQTYSLPVAALFATTMVYGRPSSDHDPTACRAAGISALTLALPASLL